MKYKGDWYGSMVVWEDYLYRKKPDDPSFWPDEQMRVKPVSDYRENGGFSLDWALKQGLITPITQGEET